jgi:LCP family protein required for cell wall assembly
MNKKILVSVLLALFLAGCSFSNPTSAAQPTPVAISNILLTQQANSSLQPTPFQPILPTADASVNSQDAKVYQPTTTPSTPYAMPTFSPSRLNILVLGSDWRPNAGFRTDVILLVSINTVAGSVSFVSFPRDLYVNIPGVGEQRINTAQAFGGFDLTKATFEQNFGIHLDYYILTNFSGFKYLIDTLGGIQVLPSQALYDHCDLPQAVGGSCYVEAGVPIWMDGQTALWYVRSRYSTNDFDRTRRAQEVLVAVFHQLMDMDVLSKAPDLYSIISSNIESNMSLNDLMTLLPIASQIFSDESRIHRYTIGPDLVTNYTVPDSGAMVLLPNYDAIYSVLSQAFSQ